jgi:phosphoribosylformylglycinamidine (FGAM) synthase-like enzyme
MNPRTEQLRNIMHKYNLSCADVGEILDRTPQTVRLWRCKNQTRAIPDHALKVLENDVRNRKPVPEPIIGGVL